VVKQADVTAALYTSILEATSWHLSHATGYSGGFIM